MGLRPVHSHSSSRSLLDPSQLTSPQQQEEADRAICALGSIDEELVKLLHRAIGDHANEETNVHIQR